MRRDHVGHGCQHLYIHRKSVHVNNKNFVCEQNAAKETCISKPKQVTRTERGCPFLCSVSDTADSLAGRCPFSCCVPDIWSDVSDIIVSCVQRVSCLMCTKSLMCHASKESHASELYFRHMRLLKQSRLVGRNVKRCFGRQSLMCPKSLMSHVCKEFCASELCFRHMRLFGRFFDRNVKRCFGLVPGSRAIADNTSSFAGI